MICQRPLTPGSDNKATEAFQDIESLLKCSSAQLKALQTNPCAKKSDVMQLLGVTEAKIVGQHVIFRKEMRADGQVYDVAGSSGLYVSERYRKTVLLGPELLDATVRLSDNGIAIGCNVSQMAMPLHRLLKYCVFPLKRFLMLRKSRVIVEQKVSSFIGKWITLCLDGLLSLYALVIRLLVFVTCHRFHVQSVTTVPLSVVDIMRADKHRFAEFHSREWLQWQLDNSFTDDLRASQKFVIVQDSQGTDVGCFSYKTRFYPTASHRGFKNVLMAILLEWQTKDVKVLSDNRLMMMAIRAMLREPVDAIEICTDDHSLCWLLRWLCFVPLGVMNFVVRATERSSLRKHDGWDRQENWRLRPADGDNGLS